MLHSQLSEALKGVLQQDTGSGGLAACRTNRSEIGALSGNNVFALQLLGHPQRLKEQSLGLMKVALPFGNQAQVAISNRYDCALV